MVAVARSVRCAQAGELDAVRALLERCGLSVADLDAVPLTDMVVAIAGGQIAGTAALQRFGDAGLLRSVAVEPDCRGQGTAAALVDSVEARARTLGLRELWLLTTSAQGYFAQRGYRAAARADAPPAVQTSSQFALLCPASAACMVKAL